MKPTKSGTVILSGFGLIILILIVLFAALLVYINKSTGQLQHLANLNRADTLAIEMRQAATQRNVILLRMVMNNDLFYREEQSQEFYRQGSAFLLAGEEFERMSMSTAIHEAWLRTLESIQISGTMQKLAMDTMLSNFNSNQDFNANRMMVEKLIPAQRDVLNRLEQLRREAQNQIDEQSRLTLAANSNILLAMSLTGLLGILTSVGIALYVVRASSRSEQSLVAAREEAYSANKSKSQFLANMSHEIRTPLTVIIGFADALHDPAINDTKKIEFIDAISRSGRHLLGIINDILDMSKIEANKMGLEVHDVSPLNTLNEIKSLLAGSARDKGLAFDIEASFPVPALVKTDPTRLKQVLLNLLGNAIKFTETGSVRVLCSFEQTSNRLSFDINDTGIGINAEALAKLFRPFEQADASTTRKYGGTGLGLNISKRFARMMGGDITISSTPGVGTRFNFYITAKPFTDSAWVTSWDAVSLQASNVSVSRLFGNAAVADIPALQGQVLLVDDSPDIQRLVSMYIRKTGAEVTLADNGQIAVEKALGSDFDLILMDMQMPVMDGLEATEWLRKTGFDKPIVALTANAMQDECERFFAAGANELVAKPIEQAELFAMLRIFLKPATVISESVSDDLEYQELVEQFRSALPSMLWEITQALQQGNIETVRSVAHKLKGMGGSFGQQEISMIAATIESLAFQKQTNSLSTYIAALNAKVQELVSQGNSA